MLLGSSGGFNVVNLGFARDAGTIEEVFEPFLIQEGYLKRTPRGREVTELAYIHLNKVAKSKQEKLF